MEFLLTTERGIEHIAAREVEELIGRHPSAAGEGRLHVHGEVEDILKLNYCSNSLHRVILLLLETKFSELDEIYDSIRDIHFPDYIASNQTFAVRASRMGEHGFTSVDVARVAGQAVIDAYLEAKGTRLKVDLTSPDVVVCVEIRYDRCYVGIDTTGESLHRRGYRVYQHPASLKPSIAYALIRIAEWNAGESLLDPFCGSGTICIEAARFAWRMPNLLRKDTFLFWKLPFLPLEEFRDMILNLDRRIKKGELSIRGCDISPKHIEGAKQNASKADVKVSFYICDATEVELNCDKLIANPPYGLRLGSKYKAARLYRKFEHHLFNSTWERAVILTACPQFFETKPTKRFDIIYGNLPASILVFE